MAVTDAAVRDVVSRLRCELPGAPAAQVHEAVGFWWRMLGAEAPLGDLAVAMARLDALATDGWLVLSVTALTPGRDRWLLCLAAPL